MTAPAGSPAARSPHSVQTRSREIPLICGRINSMSGIREHGGVSRQAFAFSASGRSSGHQAAVAEFFEDPHIFLVDSPPVIIAVHLMDVGADVDPEMLEGHRQGGGHKNRLEACAERGMDQDRRAGQARRTLMHKAPAAL